jgi:outer membrane protein OmpA-like peptidoglycan-associated protein
MRGMRFHLSTLLLLVTLGACTSTPPPAQQAPAPAPTPDQRAAVPANLTVEQQWLNSWFKGTPVRIRQVGDSAITIDVPREFCFDPGKSSVKPALGAVLDKMTQSLQRLPLANVTLIAAPGDASGATQLALQRATQVQAHLRAAGVRAERLGKPSAASAPAVQLRMEASPL